MQGTASGGVLDDGAARTSARGLALTALVLTIGFTLGWLAQLGIPGLHGFSVMWPQRWSFFTGLYKNEVVAYRFVDAGRALAPLDEIGWNGLGRAAETRNGEAWQFARRVPDDHWQSCTRLVPVDCGFDLDGSDVFPMVAGFPGSHLCGRLAFSLEKTEVPSAAQLPSAARTVFRVALVDLDCGR
ncbi:hypothetical protein ACFWN2_08535 [Lentzea sp. NPDC058436]|uniref:hypothetical protein n=1 Tax=Lentzea sp. NPDC058436 TaxID=3346499 RepID=UPI0036552174